MSKLSASPSQTLGPFYAYGLLTDEDRVLAGPSASGQRVSIEGVLINAHGDAARDAMIELWQADAEGRYPGHSADADPDFKGFGRVLTNAEGRFSFETVVPGAVAGEGNRSQAPHFAISVFAAGLTRRLITRVYVPDTPELDGDQVLEGLSETARASLIADAKADDKLFIQLNLGGDAPTAFFTD